MSAVVALVWGVRPQLLGFSLAPVVLVALLMGLVQDLPVGPVTTALCAAAVACVQCGLHLLNTFFDHRAEVDKKGQPGGDALLVGGHAEPLFVATVGAALLGGGVALGLLLGGFTGGATVCLVLAAALGVLYSFPLKHYYGGDVIVMLCFGPLVAQFTAYVLGAEAFVTEFVPVLLPHLLLVEAWLMCCNGRDVAHDNKVKSYTLATSMGSEASMLTYALVLCLAFLAILQLVVFSSLWYAVILLSGPLGYPCLRGALKMDTQGLPGQTIRLHALVTGLTALGVVLADTFSFVEPPPPADSIF